MTVTQLAAWVMLAFGGLFSGAILVFAVERVNLWRRMPVDQYGGRLPTVVVPRGSPDTDHGHPQRAGRGVFRI